MLKKLKEKAETKVKPTVKRGKYCIYICRVRGFVYTVFMFPNTIFGQHEWVGFVPSTWSQPSTFWCGYIYLFTKTLMVLKMRNNTIPICITHQWIRQIIIVPLMVFFFITGFYWYWHHSNYSVCSILLHHGDYCFYHEW